MKVFKVSVEITVSVVQLEEGTALPPPFNHELVISPQRALTAEPYTVLQQKLRDHFELHGVELGKASDLL